MCAIRAIIKQLKQGLTSQFAKIVTRCSRRRQTSPSVPSLGELDNTYAECLIRAYSLHYLETWRHLQNRKYITYRNAVTGWPSHGHLQLTWTEIWWNFDVCFSDTQADRNTDKQTNEQTRWSQYFAPLPGRSNSIIRNTRHLTPLLFAVGLVQRPSTPVVMNAGLVYFTRELVVNRPLRRHLVCTQVYASFTDVF